MMNPVQFSIRQSAAQLSALEEKLEYSPVFGILAQASFIDYPGRLCRVMFIGGCNLRCHYCHNNRLINRPGETLSWPTLAKVLERSRAGWVDAVTVTGGEPTCDPRLPSFLGRLKEMGLKVKLDTNGTRPEVIENVLPSVDYIAMDYKAPLARYPEICGMERVDENALRESVRIISESGKNYEFRTTVVDGFHGREDILRICREIEGAARFALQAFVPRNGNGSTGGAMFTSRTPGSLILEYEKLCQPYFGQVLTRGI